MKKFFISLTLKTFKIFSSKYYKYSKIIRFNNEVYKCGYKRLIYVF